MTNRLPIFILLLALISSSAIAQIKIKGNVIDEKTDEFVEFANISLLKNDSSFVKEITTDEKGIFTFNNIPSGDYILYATYVGYNKSYTTISNSQKNIDLGSILLHPSDISLNEVTVTGKSVVYKSDRQLIMPSKTQIESSNNGLKLLENLNLARIIIDPMTKAVSMMGSGNVQLRINGVEVSNTDIQALSPQDIVRIEYHDDPGMRYNNAGAVIDFITRHKESGGNISAGLFEGVTDVGFGEDYLSARFNHKKSEFNVTGNRRYRNIDWTRENMEKFVFPTTTLERNEIGEPTRFKQSNIDLALNYNLQQKDKYQFNIKLRNRNEDQPSQYDDRISTIYSSDGSDPRSIVNHSTWKNNSPSLDIYYQQDLKNDQLLIFNIVGTYLDSKSTRLYTEHQNNNQEANIYSHILGDKHSLIVEGIYEKKLKTGTISSGIKHTQTYTENRYSGNMTNKVSMNTAETYLYTEYQLKKGKFSYAVGLGAMRTYNSQGENSNQKYIFRPSIRATYNINDNLFLRYRASISGSAPSLSDLNDIEQEIDLLQIRRGNPNLRTVTVYTNNLSAGYNKGIVNVEMWANYSYDRKPIMEELSYENDKFVRMNENQRGFHRMSVYTNMRLKLWSDYIVMSVSPFVRQYISQGNDYTHTYTNWGIRSSLTFNYKGWTADASIQTRYNDLWAQTISRGERSHSFSVGYNATKWSLGAWVFNPLSKNYMQDSREISKLTPKYSKVYTDNLGGANIITLTATINVNFGRQYDSANKRLNNNDADAGILK